MKLVKSISTNHQIALFFALTYILSWWTVPFLKGGLFPFGPALAAIIVLGVSRGRKGIRGLLSRVTRWRVAWPWYVLGPMVILFSQGTAYFLFQLLGVKAAQNPHLPSLGAIVSILLVGGWWEEIGWSGYALPKLQERFANRPNHYYSGALTLGIFRAIWHIPLFLYGKVFWFDIFFFEIAFQLLIAWVFHRSSGSILAVMLLHLSSNFFGLIFYPVYSGIAHTNYHALFMALETLIVFGIILKSWHSDHQQIHEPSYSSYGS